MTILEADLDLGLTRKVVQNYLINVLVKFEIFFNNRKWSYGNFTKALSF